MQQETLKRFDRLVKTDGYSKHSRIGYVMVLRDLGVYAGKPFKKMNREDIAGFLSVKVDLLKETSLNLYKAKIKRFWKWLKYGKMRGRKYSEEVDWIEFNAKVSRLPVRNMDDLVTEEEIEKLILAASNPCEKALVATLWDSGCRIGELLGLKLKHVSFHGRYAALMVDGKTGQRRVIVTKAFYYLQLWINHHPQRALHSRDADLWVHNTRRGWKPYTYNGVYWMITDRLPRRAGIQHHLHHHLFRHTKATRNAKRGMSEAQMDQFFGWVQGSSSPRKYIHLAGRDLDDVVLELEGVTKPKEPVKDPVLEPVSCPRCTKDNPGDAVYCYGCGLALKEEAAEELSSLEKAGNEYMKFLKSEKNQEIMQAILQKIDKGELDFLLEVNHSNHRKV